VVGIGDRSCPGQQGSIAAYWAHEQGRSDHG
jgi:hypothetical protein